MSQPPWYADRFLDAELAASVVALQFPSFAGVSVEYLARGFDNDCYVFGGEFIFRFPRRKNVVPWIEKEIALLPVVAERIGIAVPRFEFVGAPSEAFLYPFVGYRMLPGEPWKPGVRVDVAGSARVLAEAMTRLHEISLDAVSNWASPSDDWGPAEMMGELLAKIDRVREAMPLDLLPVFEPYWDGRIPQPPNFVGERKLLHYDLSPEHVLFDADSGLPTAIIDWADAGIGDPIHELGAFEYTFGQEYTEVYVEHYLPRLPEESLKRMRFQLMVHAPVWLMHARENEEDDFEKHLGLIRGLALRASTED